MEVTMLDAVEKKGDFLLEVVFILGRVHFMVSYLLYLLVCPSRVVGLPWGLLVDGFLGLRSGRWCPSTVKLLRMEVG